MDKKVALVTGASRGIGRQVALTLARDGAFVIVNYNGSQERAMEVVNTIKENGGDAAAYRCNVSDFTMTEEMVKDLIKTYGHVDILVNNAGITRDNLIMKMSEEDFDKVIETNLKGCFNTIRHLTRQMLKQRSGKIINIASVSGVLGNAGQANYAASKAGIIGLTKTMARELASRGINVNAIAPGFIRTEMTDVLSDAVKETVTAQIPLKKFGKTEDIAEMAAFLASEKADYITGQVINVDGGMAM
ncbi:MAG: 3-oxoacyl-[acyl-carrier-protein] reductase [Clostridiales bacterium]|nr:3-oxoacyl-[acyl-carrier-protein] reductase [Clostridiales bacterium]